MSENYVLVGGKLKIASFFWYSMACQNYVLDLQECSFQLETEPGEVLVKTLDKLYLLLRLGRINEDNHLIIEHLLVSFYITYIIHHMLDFSLDCMSLVMLWCDYLNQTQSLTCQKLPFVFHYHSYQLMLWCRMFHLLILS